MFKIKLPTDTYNLDSLIELNLSLNKEYSVDELNAHCIEGKCKNETCKNNFKRKFCELDYIHIYQTYILNLSIHL